MRLALFRGGAALAAAAMSLTFAACGDDVTPANQDLSMPDLSGTVHPDLSNVDATAVPDLARGPGTAQLTLADIVGTFYVPNGAGGEVPLPGTHILFPQQSFPLLSTNPQYIDSDFSSTPGAVHGCLSNRYDIGAGVAPTPDENVGAVSYSGYNAALLAADKNTPPGTLLPTPGSINCGWGGAALPYYGCIFGIGTMDAGATTEGQDPKTVLFPLLPAAAGSCAGFPTTTLYPDGTHCEQHPFIANTTAIAEGFTGGTNYGAKSANVPAAGGLPPKVTIIKINGAAPASALDPLKGVVLDGSGDVTITWSCDGTATAGSGCPTGFAGAGSLVGVFAVASIQARSAFATGLQFGTMQCVEQAGSATATVTLKQAAIQRLMMGQSVGTGSALVAVAYLNANLGATMGHSVFFTAGAGDFGLINH